MPKCPTCTSITPEMPFYEMYEFKCECFETILNPPTAYPEIYQDGSNWTGNWDQKTRNKAQGLLTSSSSGTIIVTKNVLDNVQESGRFYL